MKKPPAKYDPAKIEARWQKKWAKDKLYKTTEDANKPKYYVLDMFPYPSGEGLHVGHPKGYIATDVISRMKRMQGKSVLHPMGFDAFGLPAENYAIKMKINPMIAVARNVERFKEQLELLGFDYDWSREVNTTDPAYYRWTQWIFLQLWKKGLAYESNEPVNWCPTDKTVLANEDVENGLCERCGTPIEKKALRQWVLKITEYADRLLKDLDGKNSIDVPLYVRNDSDDAPKKDLPFEERNAVICIIKHWSDNSFLCSKYKDNGWRGFIIGGIETGEDAESASMREAREESGYQNIRYVRTVGRVDTKFYHSVKKVNRFGHFTCVYLELIDGAREEMSEAEKNLHDIEWVSADHVREFINREELKYLWDLQQGIKKQDYKPLLDWPESIKEAQRNWIGRSEGALLDFPLKTGQSSKKKILVGTRNKAKIQMMKACLKDEKDIDLISLDDIGAVDDSDLVEGNDWKENARMKSEFYFKKTGIPTISTDHVLWIEKWKEDNGIITHIRNIVNPKTGQATDEEIIDFLIRYLKGVGGSSRAHFIFATSYTDSSGTLTDEQVPYEYVLQMERAKDYWPGYPTEALLKDPISGKYKTEQADEVRYATFIKTLKDKFIPRFLAADSIQVFTTRPDTLFGVTYVVLAPEHKMVNELLSSISNKAEVEAYISKSARETEIERTDAKKEKTGVELKGIKAINPANGEEVPVWIADYVLVDYGTGAVMAVPAHDERDWEFAKKFGLKIKDVIVPVFGESNPKDDLTDGSIVVVFDQTTHLYACLHWKDPERFTIISGGREKDETYEKTARREISEEAGINKVQSWYQLGEKIYAHYYNDSKKKHKAASSMQYLAVIDSVDIGEHHREAHENFDVEWKSAEDILRLFDQTIPKSRHLYEILGRAVHLLKKIGLDTMADIDKFGFVKSVPFLEPGILIDSGKFSGTSSASIMKEITAFVGGKWVTKYKLRDWVFSRQRYWGEPIPLIRCKKCGIVPVPEKDLPVKLPKVESYEPTGTGESPLAAISKWVNVKCPNCKGPAKRETNTMPQWAGSCWYYLRYEDPKNKKALVDPKKEKYWSPVDLYVGGAEHATRHLIYARFWHKFLNDIGVVSTSEPFTKLQSVGLIMGEDGRKMSKRFGNVVNPDDIVKIFGADTLRLYEMFMGPFDQAIAWSTESMVGPRRFIEKVWRLAERVATESRFSKVRGWSPQNSGMIPNQSAGLERTSVSVAIDHILHKTIKKVTDDIVAMRFNTAVSTLMIAVNELEKSESLSREQFEILLKLLAPFAPHVTEELWISLGNKKSIHLSEWPTYDPKLIIEDENNIVVQINGKVRGSFKAVIDSTEEQLKTSALGLPESQKWLEGKSVKKIIVVKGRLVSIVAA